MACLATEADSVDHESRRANQQTGALSHCLATACQQQNLLFLEALRDAVGVARHVRGNARIPCAWAKNSRGQGAARGWPLQRPRPR